MVGELTSRQILALAKDGLDSGAIAKSLDIEEALVRLVLARHVPGADRDIDDEQLASLRRKAYTLAMSAEDETVSARMVMFLIERDKPSKAGQGSSIMAINNAIVMANENFNKMIDEYSRG